MKRIIFIIVITISTLPLFSQNETDALRYSMISNNGTARFVGMGGSFGAIGGNFSSLSINPAGIGLFRKSEFTFTPSFYKGKIKSDFNDENYSDYKYNFNLGNIGIVLAIPGTGLNSEAPGWRYVQLGFGINRQNNFNNRMIIEGYNSSSSIIKQYVDYANNDALSPDELYFEDTRLAYDTRLIKNKTGKQNEYTSPFYNGEVLQRQTVNYSGSSNEFVFSAGANYNDKLYIGATVGLPYIRYKEKSEHYETDLYNKIDSVKNFYITDKLDESGQGINIKAGLIYKLNEIIRLGAAIHSPTFYKITQNFKRTIESNLDNGKYLKSSSSDYVQNNEIDYHLETPMKAIGSIGFVFGKYGLLNLEYQFSDYSEMKLREGSNDNDYVDVNSSIGKIYSSQHTINAGAEVNIENIALRAGYAFGSSPYTDVNLLEQQTISIGLGFREKDYFFDIAYNYGFYKQDYYMYNPYLVNPSKNSYNFQSLMFTLGVKF